MSQFMVSAFLNINQMREKDDVVSMRTHTHTQRIQMMRFEHGAKYWHNRMDELCFWGCEGEREDCIVLADYLVP